MSETISNARNERPEVAAEIGERSARPAVEALYRAFYVRLVRHAAWRYGLSKEDASEVVQEAFLLAVERLDSSRNPRAWIYRVVNNLAANWKRKVDRRVRLLEVWGRSEKMREPPDAD